MATILPGDFTKFGLGSHEVMMLADAYLAICKVPEAWEYLKRPDVPEGGSFMFGPETPMLKAINDAMSFTGHTGCSYGCIMQQMSFIAKKGWDVYVKTYAPIRPLVSREEGSNVIQEEPPMTIEEAIDFMFKECPIRDRAYVERRGWGE